MTCYHHMCGLLTEHRYSLYREVLGKEAHVGWVAITPRRRGRGAPPLLIHGVT